MGENQIKKLSVLTDTGNIVGIITITDVVNIMPNFLKTLTKGESSESFRKESTEFCKK